MFAVTVPYRRRVPPAVESYKFQPTAVAAIDAESVVLSDVEALVTDICGELAAANCIDALDVKAPSNADAVVGDCVASDIQR